MATMKEKMQRAKELIQAKRYDEARAILRTVDHDKAYEWLDKLDKIAPVKTKPAFAEPDLFTPAVTIKGKNPVKSQSVTVSSRALFGKSQMDKAIEKYSAEGWELVKQTAVGGNRYLLRFERELSDEEVAREKIGRRNRVLAGMVLFIICGLYFAQVSSDNQREKSAAATEAAIAGQTQAVFRRATDAAQSTLDAVATQTATLWTAVPSATVTDTPRPTDTATITQTPLPTVTAQPTQIPLPTSVPSPILSDAGDAAEIEFVIRAITDINLLSVQVANGRPNGGDRSVIVAYTSDAISQADLLVEWGSIFGAVGSLVREEEMDIDALAIVVGDENGMTVGLVGVQMDDIIAYLDGSLSNEQFFQRLDIANVGQ